MLRAQSPRPFALHLMLAAMALMSSKAGLPRWNGGSPHSKPEPSQAWPNIPASLAADLARLDPAAFDAALEAAIAATAGGLADGVEAYRRHPYRRATEKAAVVWRQGSSVLFDHGQINGADDVPVLFAPSLINRGDVLDLRPGTGMLSWLSGQGVHPYRVEWGAPGPDEQGFGLADYVEARLQPALAEVRTRSARPVVLAGYCMGGLLALAAAVKEPGSIAALALLATPWDFHAAAPNQAAAIASLYRVFRPIFIGPGVLPVGAIQAFFAIHDPIVALRKFQRFAALDPASEDAANFVALEDWLNDGVPLPLNVADETVSDWYAANLTGQGIWRLRGEEIDPSAIDVPVLVVVPGADRIVPPASAAGIVPKLRRAERLDPVLGHIGMVVGRHGKTALWEPLAEWIRRNGR
jgi:polyhydroxyalkanoate synthase